MSFFSFELDVCNGSLKMAMNSDQCPSSEYDRPEYDRPERIFLLAPGLLSGLVMGALISGHIRVALASFISISCGIIVGWWMRDIAN